MRQTATAGVGGRVARLGASVASTRGFSRLRGREAGSAIAQDARVSDPGLATRRNPANVGLRA